MVTTTESEKVENESTLSPVPEESCIRPYPYRVEDIVFRWDKGYLQFIASRVEEFDDLPPLLRKVMKEELLYEGRFFFKGKNFKQREIFEKYFDFDFVDEETFLRIKDFFPNKAPDFKSSPFCRYWVGLNSKTFVRMEGVQSFWSEFLKKYENEMIYCIVTSKGDYSFEDVIKKLEKLITKSDEKEK